MNRLTVYEDFDPINEEYDPETLFSLNFILSRLKSAPGYMQKYAKDLPRIEKEMPDGKKRTFTKIPQVVHQYIFGNF